MTTEVLPVEAAASAATLSDALTLSMFGMNINTPAVFIGLIIVGLLFLFYRIQKKDKLDFADMITKDGRTVSLTKVLQLVGGLTATWIMIKMTLTNSMTEGLLGVYLAYVGAVEAYSKYVAAKHNYKEHSVRDVKPDADTN